MSQNRCTTPAEKAWMSSMAVCQRALDGHEISDGDTVLEHRAEAFDDMISEHEEAGDGLPCGFWMLRARPFSPGTAGLPTWLEMQW